LFGADIATDTLRSIVNKPKCLMCGRLVEGITASSNSALKSILSAAIPKQCKAEKIVVYKLCDIRSRALFNLPPSDRHDTGLIRAQFGIVHDCDPFVICSGLAPMNRL
jgi:hypothetical protein